MSSVRVGTKWIGTRLALMVVVVGMMIAGAGWARGQTLTVLHSFGAEHDGYFPDSGVILDASGNVYGETPEGGNQACFGFGCGILFEVTPGGSETILYTFPHEQKNWPTGGLIWDSQGNLYGTAEGLDDVGQNIYGGVFELAPGGNLTWLALFSSQQNGYHPKSGVILDAQGNLYGATSGGGGFDLGTIFKLAAGGKKSKRQETILHTFTGGSDGACPETGLIRDGEGNLYGTTAFGGGSGCYFGDGCGTVFKVSAEGEESVLYRFTGEADGEDPQGPLVLDSEGNLYGTANGGGDFSCGEVLGCGTVFELASDGTFTVLYAFTGEPDGAVPFAGLIMDAQGNLYGTTQMGGEYNAGTVFELTPSGTETVLYSFTGGVDGGLPESVLVFDGQGNLYGTTRKGGVYCQNPYVGGCGTVFKLTP